MPTGTAHLFPVDPTRALQRVTVADMTEGGGKTWLPGLLNPQTLSYAIEVGIGELNPVGWSSSILMYGYTKSPTVPIELYFSSQMTSRVASYAKEKVFPLREYVDWFGSFCYPHAGGLAPPPLSILWPKVAHFALVVQTFNAEYIRFHSADLSPMSVKVSLQCRELRFAFHTANQHRDDGFTKADSVASKVAANPGPGLNLDSTGRSRGD